MIKNLKEQLAATDDAHAKREILKSYSDGVKEKEYFHNFTEDELSAEQQNVVQANIELRNYKKQAKAEKAEIAAHLKRLETIADEHVINCAQKGAQVVGKVYTVIDMDSTPAKAYEFNEFGEVILERGITIEERQTNLHSMVAIAPNHLGTKTGTED